MNDEEYGVYLSTIIKAGEGAATCATQALLVVITIALFISFLIK